jgi:hypothetical protein
MDEIDEKVIKERFCAGEQLYPIWCELTITGKKVNGQRASRNKLRRLRSLALHRKRSDEGSSSEAS